MTDPEISDDFASAAMMRLVAIGLKRQGIDVGLRPETGARVPRHMKQTLLTDVVAKHGPRAILQIADSLPDMTSEPLLLALQKARDLPDLLVRWSRLEQFSHGRHTVSFAQIAEQTYACRHLARSRGAAPTAAETMLVMAVLTILSESVTGGDVELEGPNGAKWRANGNWSKATAFIPGDAVVLRGHAFRNLRTQPGTSNTDDLPSTLREYLSHDLLKRWTISDLADVTGLPPRTLQRKLAKEATSFSRLVAETRLAHAARYLCDLHGPGLSEIGFLSGYSDQPHFTRAFTAAVGTTPKDYRASFGN